MSAAPITWTYPSGTPSPAPPAGLTLTPTAWHLATLGGTFASATLGYYNPPGLGVSNSGETAGSPHHAVDNYAGFNFVMFSFSAPVNLVSAYLNQYGDTDVTYWTSSSAVASLSGVSVAGLAGLGFSSAINNNGSGSRSVDLSGTNVRTLILGASTTNFTVGNWNSYDFFKIQSVTADVPNGQVPEPSTFALLGTALVGLGWVARRRKV